MTAAQDKFYQTLNDAADQFSNRDLGASVRAATLKIQNDALRAENEQLKNDRRKWFMLLAAVLKQYGEMRVTEHTRVALEKPVITVTDDPVTGGIVVRLKQ